MSNNHFACNMSEDLMANALQQFNIPLSEDERAQIEGLFTQYLFYVPNKTGTVRTCECTHLGCGRFEVKRKDYGDFFLMGHRTQATCPKCGRVVTVLAKNKFRDFKSVQERKLVTLFRKGLDGALLLTHGFAVREYGHPFLATEFSEVSRTYLSPGIRMQWDYGYRFGSFKDYGWSPNRNMYEPFRYYDYPYLREYGTHLINPQIIQETSLRYCQMGEYFKSECSINIYDPRSTFCHVVSYLSAYVQFPNMEMAVRLGLNKAISDLIRFCKKNVRSLNWSANTVQGFMKLPKAEVKPFLSFSKDVDVLYCYQRLKKHGAIKCLADFTQHYTEFAHNRYYYDLLVDAAIRSGCSLPAAERYIEKQPTRHFETALQLWLDYLRNAKLIGYDLSQKTVSMPKNLRRKHDDAEEVAKFIRSEKKQQMGAARLEKKRALYEFEYGGLCIIVPYSSEAIIAEGNALNHCVGGYAARHMAGKLDILFLRKTTSRDKSLATIEMAPRSSKNATIHMRQIHGYGNDHGRQPAAQKYAEFLRVWKAWMSDGSPRDKQGVPIIRMEDKSA